ncbi:hypothetical protein BXY85_2978 [Roseivirga pacifica]|uniref:Lipoprotein n=1 Tax=Roseivirga pacifica TaxID=1267423 RepID=A0A1I0QY28_9BACT|nr:hypothetical protein [Roseivirga pacifica]RKQ42368.1 hypothetical protein BXY85_2978 [Roseivirga pacifica]SEW32652.1 hypothetical protein SAMN05216290_2894 [Roseivirga pacifica]
MNKLKILFATVLTLTIMACEEEDCCVYPDECPTNIGCTEEYRSLLFQPTKDGQAVLLDSYYVKNLDNDNIYNFTNNDTHDRLAAYIVATDSQLEEVKKSGSTLRFVGSANNEVVIEQDFVVGHDCCHIVGIDGPFYGGN